MPWYGILLDTMLNLLFPVVAGMDPRHLDYLAMMGRTAMQNGDHAQAVQFLSMALDLLKSYPPQFAAPLLADRAECLWKLGEEQASVENMRDAINAGLPLGDLNCEVTVERKLHLLAVF